MYVKIFQLTSSQRGWLFAYFSLFWIKTFQLTSSRRGWPGNVGEGVMVWNNFNSHPHEEDDRRHWEIESSTVHFNSHPHEEDDMTGSNPCRSIHRISTHILTKRMTGSSFGFICQEDISTHILTKRMTLRRILVHISWSYFNSHPHEEDDSLIQNREWWIYISTHILTKRMTITLGPNCAGNGISTHILTKRMTPRKDNARIIFHISTHILTKRMTLTASVLIPSIVFQLTSSRRGWLIHP